MDILDFFEPKVRQNNINDNLKWLLIGIILFGFLIQIDSFFQEIHFWLTKDPFLDLICPMGQPAPLNRISSDVYFIGFLGVIISIFILKNQNWKVSNILREWLILISPGLLLMIQYILGEIVWRFL